MKFSDEAYELISELLEEEFNSCDDKARSKQIEEAMQELDSIGTY